MDAPANKWDLVVKVKYGDTLRRFNVCVNGQGIDHDMNKLRTKIINLFKFDVNASVVLTYTDIDGDVVTLVDDDELHDAVFRQHLDPLRINVQLNTDFAARADTWSVLEALNTVPRAATQGTQAPQLGSVVDDALRSVPDPLRGILSRISQDFLSKADVSAPPLGEFVEYFSKVGLSHVSATTNIPKNAELGGASASATNPPDENIGDKPKPLHASVPHHPSVQNSTVVNQIPEDSMWRQPGMSDMMKGIASLVPDPLVDVSLRVPGFPRVEESGISTWLGKDTAEGKRVADGKSIATTGVPAVDQSAHDKSQNNVTAVPTSPVAYPPGQAGLADALSSDVKNIPCRTASSTPFGFYPQNSLPVNKHASELASNQSPPTLTPYRRSPGYYDSMLRTFHRGVRCDGCGMHPIMGPRFKSNVKQDFDLCSICFSEMGNEAEYTRIDRAPYRSPRFLKEHSRFHGPQGCRAYGLRPHKGKLESRFIQDVTVLDGTLMAPSTPFTKIWRMRNNGNIVWPSGTQLVWIGGDQFAERGSVDLEISENGFPVDKEIDIAVDFRAPSRPGRYISYWRMASPSGQKFGQRVWVLIQVDSLRPNSASSIIHPELNLNLPPEATEQSGLVIIDVNAEPAESIGRSELDLIKPLVNEVGIQSNAYPPVLASSAGSLPPLSEMPSSSSSIYPLIDLSSQPFSACSEGVIPSSGETALANTSTGDNPVEQSLLKELEEMGFKQIDLNKEVLRLNDYDLEQSLNDLCGISEWDPLLEELREMGFCDKERNKKLLIKNGGSIKRVVLDLIAGERAE